MAKNKIATKKIQADFARVIGIKENKSRSSSAITQPKRQFRCTICGGWIKPPWTRSDGDYRHCKCPL